jgi:predicted nucleotidyltransferase
MIRIDEKEALRDFSAIAALNDVPFVIVGAGARLLIFNSRYGITSTRTTMDWDIAVQVADWETLEWLKSALTAGTEPLFTQGRLMHRFKHIGGAVIDIIPFGGVESKDGIIVWPQDDKQMNVVGFHEVYLNAEHFDIGEGFFIPVATPPGLAVLKILAFNDRHRDDDIRDLYFILDNYDKANNEARIFDELADLLSSGRLDYQSAKAYLLGLDVRRLIGPRTLKALLQIFDKLQFLDPYSPHIAHLINRLGDQLEEERQRIKIANLFKAFLAGLSQKL